MILRDTLWAHAAPEYHIEHIFTRAGHQSIDIVLFLNEPCLNECRKKSRSLCAAVISTSIRFSGWRICD